MISAIFFAFCSITFIIGITENPDFNIHDLGLNLVSEILGLVFTLVIVDVYVSTKRELRQERADQKKPAQREATEMPSVGDFTILEDSSAIKSVSTLVDTQTGMRYILVVHANGSALTPLLDEEGQPAT